MRRGGRLWRALRLALLGIGVVVVAVLLLIAVKFGRTAPPVFVTEEATIAAPATAATRAGVALPELVYFGAAWQLLNKKPGMAPLVLGGGFAHARVERTQDGMFFAGTVERVGADGAVSDVVLVFAGAQGVGDAIQGMSLGNDRVRAEPRYAAQVFERVWRDPRYAKARIHVTGHSLGAGYAQFVGTAAITRHGRAAVAARVRIVGFGVPNWGPQSARYFRVAPDALDGLFTGYTALNDPVITNGGVARVGVSVFLPPVSGLTGLGAWVTRVAAHWPTTYMLALGLPDWLTPAQRDACIRAVSDRFITGESRAPGYGPAGGTPLIVQGSGHGEVLAGAAGDDLIAGGGGRDVLRGGAGNDRFALLAASDSGPDPARADRVVDFRAGDRIDLSFLDADRGRPGRQRFGLAAGRAFDAPGQVTSWVDGDTTWVAGNVDADPGADFLIGIDGAHRLTAADFVFRPAQQDRLWTPYLGTPVTILRPR